MADRMLRLRGIARGASRHGADACLVTLSAFIWISGTMLAALGVMVLVGMLVADGHPARFFLHVQNLASHFLEARPQARHRFLWQAAGFHIALTALLLLARWPVFVARLRADLARGRTHD